ncbi:hypothetical protein EDB81DRAFT_883850 [Dactylonectria macrodidyma]|uniref:Uncharacterized protein n=1 Tax=Dactylonectria macrodidyma TaxID=307937 RepID=A0A9P9J460_9HYPO|nr:hypothetical protein EDB81DRAFT_883850 [Dactylonectria macrodidyma]
MAIPRGDEDLVVNNSAYHTPIPPLLEIKLCQNTSGGRIVVLNGFPGTGKLTILKRAKQLLPADTTCLLDNHLLIDPVVAVIPGRSDEHHELRRMVRAPIFKQLRNRAQHGDIILMTACLVEDNERDAAFLQEHLDIVRATDVPIIWINAHCDRASLEERIRSPQRCQGSKTKLTDVRILRDLVREHRLIQPLNKSDGSTRLIFKALDVSGPVELSVNRLMGIIGFQQGMEVE